MKHNIIHFEGCKFFAVLYSK